MQKPGNVRGQLLECMTPLPKISSTQEYEKDMHLKYVKANVKKESPKLSLYPSRVYISLLSHVIFFFE